MADNYGYVGKILRVDLSTGVVTDVATSDYAPKYIGGRAMGAKIYWDEVMPDVGAFDPENRLIFMEGPVNGTVMPNATRTSVTAKSPIPIPECYSYSIPGSAWGPELKFAGYDGIIVQGKASEPVYLWIHDGVAEIKKAGILWGQGIYKVDQALKQVHGLQTKTAAIGPAGENLIKESVILFDGYAATGMGGFGAVMGSKNLKAIAVRGSGSVKVAAPDALLGLRQAWDGGPFGLDTGDLFFGDPWLYAGMTLPGDLQSHLEDARDDGRATKKKGGCWACNAPCQVGMRYNSLEVPNGTGTCNDIAELEQEDMLRTGKYMTTDAWEFMTACNDLGISITQILGHCVPWWSRSNHGGTWATELVWAGLWTEENTGLPVGTSNYTYDELKSMDTTPLQPELGVGSKEFNRTMLRKVLNREGIGELLAEGQQRYLRHVIETAPEHLKAIAQEIYDRQIYAENYHSVWQPRQAEDGWVRYICWAVHMVTGPAAGGIGVTESMRITDENREFVETQAKMLFGDDVDIDKLFNWFVPDHKAALSIFEQHMSMERDSVTSCMYGAQNLWYGIEFSSRAFSATTGQSQSSFEDWQKQVGERGLNLERAIMVREGRRREHDTMNEYNFTEVRNPMVTGHRAGDWLSRDLFDSVMDEYYTLRGWGLDDGIPSRSKLEELDMKDVADALEAKYGVKLPA